MYKTEYELAHNNNYSSCDIISGDKRNESINMRQQVTHKEGHIPPSSRNGRSSSDNTHSKLSNGSQQNGRNQFSNGGGGYNCTTDSSTPGSHINSSFYPTKTQIISGNTPTLERVTQVHTSHIQNHQHNNNLFTPKGKDFKY